MNKRQLIDGIREYNPTARPKFLAQFGEEALQQYLEHLKAAVERRLYISKWVRRRMATRYRLVS